MKKIILYFITISVFFSNVLAQSISTKKNALIYLDYARYQYDETSSYVEFYYSVLPNDSIINLEDIDCFELIFSVFTLPEEKLQASSNIKIPLQNYRQNNELNKQASVGIIKTVLPVGEYKINIMPAGELKTANLKKCEKTFKLDVFKNDRITLSDIEIATKIERGTNKESVFYKNTLEIVPNPIAFFGRSQKKAGYYIEVYNVSELGREGNIIVNANIVDLQGNVKDGKSYTRTKQNNSLVEIGFLDISKLESGYYTLIVSITDEKEDYAVYRKKLIYIDHPSIKPKSITLNINDMFEESEYVYLPVEIINDKIEQALYLASNREKEVIKKITSLDAKRKWLFNFWHKKSKIDVDFKDKYEKKIEQVNAIFSFRGKPGWKTDRGRVYTLYGRPDERLRNPSSADTNPYEEWRYYSIQGGVIFYFIDESGFGEYRLVHSTHKDEIYDPNWENYLY